MCYRAALATGTISILYEFCCILWSGAVVNVATASDAISEELSLLPR